MQSFGRISLAAIQAIHHVRNPAVHEPYVNEVRPAGYPVTPLSINSFLTEWPLAYLLLGNENRFLVEHLVHVVELIR